MGGQLQYDINPTEVRSLEAFGSARGTVCNGVRQVYFVRAIGTAPDLANRILDLDRTLSRGNYLRTNSLPVLTAPDSPFYEAAYRQWGQNQTVRLKSAFPAEFGSVLSGAMETVLRQFQSARTPPPTDSICRNFGVKLLFWTDHLLQPYLPRWTPDWTGKIVLGNVLREQEYLFGYLLTQLGWDVLLLHPAGDGKITPSSLALSQRFDLGPCGRDNLPAYSPAPPQTAPKVQIPPRPVTPRPAAQQTQPRQPQAPPRQQPVQPNPQIIQRPQPAVQRPAPTQAPAVRQPIQPVSRSAPAPRQEKSYEELAALAPSVVMIGVLNRERQITATGSGIVIGRGGYILTNFHVVERGAAFAVRIEDDQQTYLADHLIKVNPKMDLAILRIPKELKPLPLYAGKKPLVRGQRVVAIGSPLGLFNSVSDGIIAGFRVIDEVNMIQFTAPISHGSSGGAVLNLYGEVIGISTAGLNEGQNLNLAVPYEEIRGFAGGLLTTI